MSVGLSQLLKANIWETLLLLPWWLWHGPQRLPSLATPLLPQTPGAPGRKAGRAGWHWRHKPSLGIRTGFCPGAQEVGREGKLLGPAKWWEFWGLGLHLSLGLGAVQVTTPV
jgi:hypothetical protein